MLLNNLKQGKVRTKELRMAKVIIKIRVETTALNKDLVKFGTLTSL